ISSKMLGRDLQEDLSITSQGAVDFGVADMGDARSGKRTPIDLVMEHGGAPDATDAALWLCDHLGRDPASLGWQDRLELEREGAEIAARLSANDDGTVHDQETGEVLYDPDAPPSSDEEFPERLTYVPGLVGDIVEWILATARRPNRTLALGAALTIVGTAMGRYMAGPTTSSTVLYVLALAPSGTGKDHPLQCIKRVLMAAGMEKCVGADEFASGPAVISMLRRTALAVCPMDEFGSFLKRINGRKAGGWESQITKHFRTLWGVNYNLFSGQEQAASQGPSISAPHISIYGTGIPEEVFAALEGGDVINGFINRFVYMPVVSEIAPVRPAASIFQVPKTITDRLRTLHGGGVELRQSQILSYMSAVIPEVLPWSDPAIELQHEAMEADMIRRGRRDKELQPFVARTAEIALRLATIVAQGRNTMKPSLTKEDLAWGQEVALWSSVNMARACGLYIADTEAQADANRILRIVKDYGGKASRRMILQRLKHRMKGRDLEDAMKSLLESGALVVLGE
ncbi:MAG: hypothetical protein B7Y70_16390, partial [Rhizobiales bacterium 35-68-8]